MGGKKKEEEEGEVMLVETKEGGVNAQRTFVSLSGREGGRVEP